MSEKTNKIVAMLLVFTLTFANWSIIGKAVASSIQENLETQGTKTNVANVEFDAYFEENGVKTHTAKPNMEEEAVLNLDVEVKENGYLKDAYIDFSNIEKYYEISKDEEKIENLAIKQVNAGELLKLTVGLAQEEKEEIELANLKNVSSIMLKGTFVNKEGKEEKVEKEIKVEVEWKDEAEVKVEQEYIRNEKYETEEESGRIIQSKITVSRNEGKHLPVEETEVVVKAEKIEGKKLAKVIVSTTNLGLTNGTKIEGTKFTKENWEYNEETGEIRIEVKNEEVNGKVWNGEGKDEYIITYIYEDEKEEGYTTIEIGEEIELKSDIEVRIKEYNKEEKIEAKQVEEKEVEEKENEGEIELYTIDEISKGKIYANQIVENKKYEASYATKVAINVAYAKIAKEVLILNMPEDKVYASFFS